MNADDKRHGTSAGYCAGCRCDTCRTAIADYSRDLRKRQYLARGPLRVDATGTKRRIRALMAMGWSSRLIDAGLRREPTYTSAILCGPDRVLFSTANRVRKVYDEMSMQTPPNETRFERQKATRIRNLAARNGWPPPLAWDDIDDPDEQPSDWQYVPPTRAEVFADLVEAKVSVSEACRRLELSAGALEKWCDRAGLRPEFNEMNARERAVFEHRNQWSA